MGKRKKSPLKPTEDTRRYNLRRKVEPANGPKQLTSELSTSSVTVASNGPARKKTTSATTIDTVTPMGPTRKVRSDTSVVTVDTTCPIATPATINGNRRVVEDTVADVVTRIATKSVEYRKLQESVVILNGKMDTVMDKMDKESFVKQDTVKEVENIKKELQKQREDFNEMKTNLTDFGNLLNRAIELLQRKEPENKSVLEMSTGESETISVEEKDEFNATVQENSEKSRLTTIVEVTHNTTQQTDTSMINTVTHGNDASLERTDPTVTRRTNVSMESSTPTVTHRNTLVSERSTPTVTHRNTLLSERSTPTVTHRNTLLSERSTPTVTHRNTLLSERSTPTVTHRNTLLSERSTPTVTHRNTFVSERSTPTVTHRNTLVSERCNPSSEFSTMTIMDESPLVNRSNCEADSSRVKKQFNRITFASSSLATTPIRADLPSDGEQREGSLASLLCDSIRRRGSSLATSVLSESIGESPATGRLSVASGEVSEQVTSETRARRSSMDLARHILEKRTTLRSINTIDDSIIIQDARPTRRNQETPDSVICLGTPYRPTPPMINLVTSYNEATPRRTNTYRARSSMVLDNSVDLQSAKDSLRRTNNDTVERDILNATMRAEDPNTSATYSDT